MIIFVWGNTYLFNPCLEAVWHPFSSWLAFFSLLIPKRFTSAAQWFNAHLSFVVETSLQIPKGPKLNIFQAASYIYFWLKLARNTCALAWPGTHEGFRANDRYKNLCITFWKRKCEQFNKLIMTYLYNHVKRYVAQNMRIYVCKINTSIWMYFNSLIKPYMSIQVNYTSNFRSEQHYLIKLDLCERERERTTHLQ